MPPLRSWRPFFEILNMRPVYDYIFALIHLNLIRAAYVSKQGLFQDQGQHVITVLRVGSKFFLAVAPANKWG